MLLSGGLLNTVHVSTHLSLLNAIKSLTTKNNKDNRNCESTFYKNVSKTTINCCTWFKSTFR